MSEQHILLIDTASNNCSVALATNGQLNSICEVNEPHIHSRKLTPYIQHTLNKAGVKPQELESVGIGRGPGSYTGLRIGVATAKSLCYSLDIPLVSINSLYSIAVQSQIESEESEAYHCPMLDARRMEVYTALFDTALNFYQHTSAIVIDEKSFSEILNNHIVYFAGNGVTKAKPYLEKSTNARFAENIWPSATYMVKEAKRKVDNGETEFISTFEPYYLKSFKANQSQKINKVLNS